MILKRLMKIRVLNPLRRNYHVSATLHNTLIDSPNAQIDKTVFNRYMELPIPESKVRACYIWVDGTGINLRCKTRTLDFIPQCCEELPRWNFDGSSTGQSVVRNSDCTLLPIAMYNDPILRDCNKLVLCETLDPDNKPTSTNHRNKCAKLLEEVCEHEVMFGFEQEFLLIGPDGRPFGWPKNGETSQDVAHYCGLGANNTLGRTIIESLYQCCLYCGIEIYGTNAEVMPSQWEFQTGPTLNIKSADDLWIGRWILQRVAEDYGVAVSYEPKLYPYFSGSGMHANYSTKQMREEGGLKFIEQAVAKLEKTHKEHIAVYDIKGGEDNKKRLTGKNETSHIEKFTTGVGDRSAAVRISRLVAQSKKGYLEDRRPAANADPYQIINVLLKSTLY